MSKDAWDSGNLDAFTTTPAIEDWSYTLTREDGAPWFDFPWMLDLVVPVAYNKQTTKHIAALTMRGALRQARRYMARHNRRRTITGKGVLGS